MPVKNIVVGQKIDPRKAQRAREMRHAMTEAEKQLWQHLRANRLGGWHFRRQQVIGEYIVDFYCHAAGLVVELDGEIHKSQVDYDQERNRTLQTLGMHVLRFDNRAVFMDLETVLDRIERACREGI